MKLEKPNAPLAKKSISFPAVLFARAERRANKLNRNFSNYLQSLVLQDLAKEVETDAPKTEEVAA